MKLEYDEIKSIQEENVQYEKDGELLTANLMITEYVPKSFEGTTKNFCLRENHENWDNLHFNFKEKCEREWLEELGYDYRLYYVDHVTKEIKNNPGDNLGSDPSWKILQDVESEDSQEI
tara:strand:+ start:106 stop:462 length:357 start_codon:yes stop_codon:yes gene_type:complete